MSIGIFEVFKGDNKDIKGLQGARLVFKEMGHNQRKINPHHVHFLLQFVHVFILLLPLPLLLPALL